MADEKDKKIMDDLLDDHIKEAEDVLSTGMGDKVEEPIEPDDDEKPVISIKKAVDVKGKDITEEVKDKVAEVEKKGTEPVKHFGEVGTVEITRAYKIGKEEKEESVSISTPIHIFRTQPALVNVKMGATINMGNYESARADVSVTMPCYVEDIEYVYKKVTDFVEGKVEDQVNEIKNPSSDDDDDERTPFV